MAGAASIARIGGHVALDFANTAGWHASDERLEHLTSYDEWLAWIHKGGVIPSTQFSALEAEARRHPARAAGALAEVVKHRELVYRVFAAIARGRSPAVEDLERLHGARISALTAAEPGWERGRFWLRWPDGQQDLLGPVHPLVLAASELLQSPALARLRQCGNAPCGWLFLDQSKNGSRRWCSSAECGNATRVRRFRARQTRGV
jgi:predicted RNA-binding Zn ribbon-like protein